MVENTAPRAGNIARDDVINVPRSRIFKQEFNEVTARALFPSKAARRSLRHDVRPRARA